MMKGVCTVMTKDGGVKHSAAHEPVLLRENTPLFFNVTAKPQPDQTMVVRLRICARCGVTYMDGIERSFAEALPKPSPTTTTPSKPPEGDH